MLHLCIEKKVVEMRNKRNGVLINSITSSKITILLTALIVFIIATTFAQATAPGSVGVYDPNTGQWAVGNDPANAEVFGFGWAGTEPIIGDWNGDGIDEVGVYNREGNNFVIQNGASYDVIGLGWEDVTPVVGDWNGDGKDDVGVRGPYSQWALWNSNTDSAEILGKFGGFGSKPIVGDWNGDGKDDVGVYNPSENYFVIKNGARYDRIHLGWNDVIPMVGDWNGDGMDDVGVYDPNTGQWAVGNDPATARIFGFGWAGTEPIAGDWNGDGTDEVGVYNRAGNNFLIQNGASYDVIGLGWNGVIPLVGDWSTGEANDYEYTTANLRNLMNGPIKVVWKEAGFSQNAFVINIPAKGTVTVNVPIGTFEDYVTFNGEEYYGDTFTIEPGIEYDIDYWLETEPTTPTTPTTPTDKAPVLAAIGDKSVNEGSQLSFTISATDPDGDRVTYSATGMPSGAHLDASTGRFTWTPGSGAADRYTVKFIATANGQTDSETITITVSSVNRPPVLTAIGSKTVDEGKLLSFTISATDPDGDRVTYSATGLPSGSNLDASTGRFTWTPESGTADKYTVKFIATANGQTDSETVTITVKAAELKDYIPHYSGGSTINIKNDLGNDATVVWTKVGSKTPVFVVNIPSGRTRSVEIPGGTFDEYIRVTYSTGHQWYDAGTYQWESGKIYNLRYYWGSTGGLPKIPDSEAPNI